MNTKLHFEGFFKFVATKRDGTQRVLADWHRNLILDGGLNRLGVGGVLDNCQVGEGNTAPAVGQTALVDLVATTTNVLTTTAGTNTPTNTYAWVRRVYRFAEGAAAGNLAEVGIGFSGGLFSRSLIRDALGDPTTITVLADESLDVTYEVRAYPTMSDTTNTVNISGVDYDFTFRPANFAGNQSNVGDWPEQMIAFLTSGFVTTSSFRMNLAPIADDFALAAVTGMPSGTFVSGAAESTKSFRTAYVSNSYERACRVVFGLSGPTVPVGGFHLQSMVGNYQIGVVPDIPKDGTKILTLDFTLSWARRP